MSDITQSDLTLPGIDPPATTRAPGERLVITLAFHADTSRIGERLVVPRRLPAEGWYLGRHCPGFGRANEPGAPLADAHISRRAVRLSWAGQYLQVHRCEGSSRCRLAGNDISGTQEVDPDTLRRGLPLMLSHSALLFLRLVPQASTNWPDQAGGAALLGGSPEMCALRAQLASAARSDLDVLLLGETGTGKELAASILHEGSSRGSGPLVSVNMAAIPAELAPAALFGAARGAYTGAERAQRGYFERAEAGSLFLDEVGDTCQDVQPQLLRALQQREIQQVGGSTRRVDVRVLSATDARIDDRGSGFKVALRHRLGALEIRLPALREHPDDIGELLLHYLREAASGDAPRCELPSTDSSPMHTASWACIFEQCLLYDWPGNVRQLANAARQLMLASDRYPEIPPSLARQFERGAADEPVVPRAAPLSARRMRDVCDATFDEAMAAGAFEPQQVARVLGVSRSAVYRRIELAGYRLAGEIPVGELREVLARCGGDPGAAARELRVSANSLRSRLRRLSL